MKKVNKSMFKSLEGNLMNFKEEFICAGPRSALVGVYDKLTQLGAVPRNYRDDLTLLSSGQRFVILCINSDGIKSKFAQVSLMKREWWDYWHNKKWKMNKPIYRTYNVPKQLKQVTNLLDIRELELLIPEIL